MKEHAHALAVSIVERQMDRIEKDGKGFCRNDMIEEAEREILVVLADAPQNKAAATPNKRPALGEARVKGPEGATIYPEHIKKIEVTHCDIEALQRATKGEWDALWTSFHWATSPQGEDYWRARATGKFVLSLGDIAFLNDLLKYRMSIGV